MAIARDSHGSATGNGPTTLTIDITSAATGAWCYAFLLSGSPQTSVTFTGWTSVYDGDQPGSTHYGVWRREKVGGDTTFAPSWPTGEGTSIAWSSYTGLNASTPDEGIVHLDQPSNSASYATASSTPTAANRWALAGFGSSSSTGANQPESFTAPTGMGNVVQTTNTANRWTVACASDSNGAVTQASHTYTATLSAVEGDGGAVLLFLIPAAATGANPPPIRVKSQAAAFASTF